MLPDLELGPLSEYEKELKVIPAVPWTTRATLPTGPLTTLGSPPQPTRAESPVTARTVRNFFDESVSTRASGGKVQYRFGPHCCVLLSAPSSNGSVTSPETENENSRVASGG